MTLVPTSPAPAAPAAPVGSAPIHSEDFALVQRILAGDDRAWHQFVERYAGLILAMSRRYLRTRDQDDMRTVFASVLESLRRTRLRTYEGRASLGTWLTLVTRSHVMDHLRRQFGRDLKLRALERLTEAERTLFRLYYVEGLSPGEVMTRLGAPGDPWTPDRFVAVLHQIERRLGDRWLKRISYDLHAQSIGAGSGRLLEYLDHVRDEFSEHAGAHSPEYYIMEREARRTTDHLRASIAALGARDRRMVELRFEQGWTARRIAAELGMSGQKSVYKALDRILGKLRRLLPRWE